MRRLITLILLVLTINLVKADEVTDVFGEVRGLYKTSTAIKINISDNGTITAIAIHNDYAILPKDKWRSIHVPMRSIEKDIADPNISKEVKDYLLADYPKKKWYANTKIDGKSVTIIF